MTATPSPEFLQLRAQVENYLADEMPVKARGKSRLLMLAANEAAESETGQAFIAKGHYEVDAFLDLVASGGLEDVS